MDSFKTSSTCILQIDTEESTEKLSEMEFRKQRILQNQFCFVIGFLFVTTQIPASVNAYPSVEGSSSSEGGLLPCSYRGQIILHGEQLIIDECTSCGCDNSTVKCDIKSCPSIFCDWPLRISEVCCDICPYNVPIYEVNARELHVNTERKVNNIVFDLNLKINSRGIGVNGVGLWKLSVWGSCSANGEGERVSYQEQVLTEEQAATELIRPLLFGGFDFYIRNIGFSLDRTGQSCSETEFVCYEFNKGDNPDPEYPQIPFTVTGVVGEDSSWIATENLKGCISKYTAEIQKPCSYHGDVFRHGQDFIVDDCLTVTCNNGEVQEDAKSCPPVNCDTPVKFEGECCKRCPYYVPIYEINARMLNTITKRKVNDIVFDLNMNINSAGASVTGHGLWKLNVWGSGRADGEGERISYQEQVLTEEQEATKLTRRGSFNSGFEFNISNIAYSLDGTDATCSEMEFLCYEFQRGDNPNVNDTRLSFTVEGVAGEHDSTHVPQNLRGCTRFSKCLEAIKISETNACLIKGSVAGGRTSNPYKINYNMIMGDGISLEEQGLWQLTAYGSISADGTGEKLNPTTETFDARQASIKLTPEQFVYFGKVDFDVSMDGQTCDTVQYMCVELGLGSRYTQRFAVNGIEENALRSCVHAFCNDKPARKFRKNILASRSRN